MYLYGHDKNIDISHIEFTNACRGQDNNQPLINIRRIDSEKAINRLSSKGRIYKISGKFDFYPNLKLYPFDNQKLSISFQPVTTEHTFYIQPPKSEFRDTNFFVNGWEVKGHYVGINQEVITGLNNYVSEKVVMPFYNFNYTWLMERSSVDYFLKVVIPLFVILMITYFSIFIPEQPIR